MRSRSLICTLLLLCVLQTSGMAADICLQVGVTAPQIQLPDLQGRQFDLAAQAGEHKAVIVLFWGVWCPYCRELMVNLKHMYPELKKQGLEVIAVSMRESPHKVELFVNKLQPGFPVLVDEWGKLKDAYRIRDVPRVVIMNEDLMVQATRITTSTQTMVRMVDTHAK